MVDKVQGVPGVNPITAQIPNFVLQQMQAQRQQQLAAMLSEQGSSPIEYDPRGRISWTQGLAKALQSGMGAYLGSQAMGQQAGLQQQGMQAMGQAYGMGAPSPTPQGQALASALQGGQQAPQAPQQAPGGQATSLNPYGAPPMLAMMASQGDPGAQEAYKTFLANQTTTPEIKNNAAFGITPDMARAMAVSKATNEGFHAFTPGESWTNTLTGQGGFAPKVPDNSQPNAAFTPGSPIPSVGVVPGAQGVAQGNAAAGALGTTAGSVHSVTNPDGSTSMGTGGSLGLVVPPQVQAARDSDALKILQQERLKPGNSPSDNAALDREIARAQGRPGVVTGPSSTDAAVQKSNADSLTSIPQQVTQSKQAVTGLEQALSVLQGVKATGPGTAKAVNWNAMLNNLGITPGKSNVENYQLAQKYLANSLNTAAAGTGASGSDARFDSFSHGQPNADTMDKAPLESAIRYVLSQHDANIARGSFVANAYNQAKAAGDPNAAQTAQAQWSKAYNPQYFAFNRMSPPEQASFLKSQGANAHAWVQGYNQYAQQTGWVR